MNGEKPIEDVFQQLYDNRERLCKSETKSGNSKKVVKKELIFFIGDIRAILSVDGWQFEVYENN